ncbi:hypothetical protein ZBT109_0920 [Zymobacter palmae]|uniref:Uncharacterized protein n=1 Tax=Zymobacter palmae TaxID=33074 RepID=A0A348HDJ1_9GAMM|nr:hypothetical protein ZBT109_0920 [Zymobacter palmae]
MTERRSGSQRMLKVMSEYIQGLLRRGHRKQWLLTTRLAH